MREGVRIMLIQSNWRSAGSKPTALLVDLAIGVPSLPVAGRARTSSSGLRPTWQQFGWG